MVDLIVDIKDRTGSAIALIEHDMHVIKSLSDEVVCMHLGAVIARGDTDSVLADPDVVSAYLGFDDTAVQRSGVGFRTDEPAATGAAASLG
jgi:ABC-type branched-subunit amino acid transport system ATPase component